MGEQAFFQIAAGLIPLLTFGGLLATRPRQIGEYEKRSTWEINLGLSLPIFGLVALGAEIFAISGALAPGSGVAVRLWVIGTILLSMVGLIATATHRYFREADIPLPIGRWGGRLTAVAVLVPLVFVAIEFNSIVRLTQETSEIEGTGSEAGGRSIAAIQNEDQEILYREELRQQRETDVNLKLFPLLAKMHRTPNERTELQLLRIESKALAGDQRREDEKLIRLAREESVLLSR